MRGESHASPITKEDPNQDQPKEVHSKIHYNQNGNIQRQTENLKGSKGEIAGNIQGSWLLKTNITSQSDWQKIFQVMKSKDLQPKLLCWAKLSFKMEGKIKSFPDQKKKKKKAKRVHLHRVNTARDAKRMALRRNGEREKHRYKGKKW